MIYKVNNLIALSLFNKYISKVKGFKLYFYSKNMFEYGFLKVYYMFC